MGLLDFMQDPKQAGLLMAAARMAEMSGPSRTPVGIGQILGGGLGAFMQTNQAMKQQQMQDAEQEQMQQYRGMQMQGMEQQQQAAKAALQRAQALQQHMAKLRGGGGSMPAASMGGEVFAGAAQRAGLSGDNGTLNQIVNGVNQGLSPDDAAARVAGGTQAQQPQESPYQRHMSMADHLRAGGYEAEANAYEDRALKFAPKVKNWEKVNVNGRILLKPYFEDGTDGAPVTTDMAEKLEFRTIGGKTIGVNSYSGDTVSTYNHTMTHGEKNARDRLNYDREQADAPTFSADLGGFVSRPSKANPQGGFTPLAGTPSRGPKITEFQGKSGAFGLRATEADKIITGLDGKYSPARVNAKLSAQDLPLVGGISGVLANNLLSEEDQKAEQAQRDFINAILRQESGMAIGVSEFLNAQRQYFPQPGDTPSVILQKARNRQLAIQGLHQNAGPAAMTAAPADQPRARKYNPATGRIE